MLPRALSHHHIRLRSKPQIPSSKSGPGILAAQVRLLRWAAPPGLSLTMEDKLPILHTTNMLLVPWLGFSPGARKLFSMAVRSVLQNLGSPLDIISSSTRGDMFGAGRFLSPIPAHNILKHQSLFILYWSYLFQRSWYSSFKSFASFLWINL